MPSAANANASGPAKSGAGDTDVAMAVHIGTRDGTLTKDAKLVNCAVEPAQQGGAAVVKRFGIDFFMRFPPGIAKGCGLYSTGGQPWGVFSTGALVGGTDRVYELSNTTPVVNTIPSISFAGEQYQSINTSVYNTNKAVIKSINGMWIVTGIAAPVKVTDVDYPFTTAPGVAYLDGTYYVMANDGTVRGSATALDDPTSWDSLSFIRPDQVLGNAAGIVRHLNYIVAFYEYGTQLYYDAGNSPGTPLAPVPNASWTVGCVTGTVADGSPTGTSIQEFEDNTYFLSRDPSRGQTISVLSGLSLTPISTPYIERILQKSNTSDLRSMAFRTGGHGYYCLTLMDTAVTIVYDTGTGEWYVWTSTDPTTGAETFFQFVGYVGSSNQNTIAPDGFLLQHATNGAVCLINQDSYQDEDLDSIFSPISARIVTPPYDWGTLNMKRFPAVNLHADTVSSTVMVRYSDDDYNTFSQWRNLDLSSVRKQLVNCGGSRRRSWELLHTANTPFRVYTLQTEIIVSNI